MKVADGVEQLEEAHGIGRAAADVEGTPADRRHVLLCEKERIDEVVDEKRVADLLAVTIQHDRPALDGANEEMCNPALVFRSVLVRAVDAAHPKDDGLHAERPRVVGDVLVGGALRASIGAVEIETAAFTDASPP